MGKINLDRFLVIDLENTCWDTITRQEQWEKTEIIEIGITEVDLIKKEILRTKSYLVKPSKTEVSEYCTQLTTITPEMVAKADALMKVSKNIRQDFNSLNIGCGAWGRDNELLIRECQKLHAVMPFSDDYTDIQRLYARMNGLEKTVSLKKVLENLSIELEGTQHRAGPDSYNTAKILLRMYSKVI